MARSANRPVTADAMQMAEMEIICRIFGMESCIVNVLKSPSPFPLSVQGGLRAGFKPAPTPYAGEGRESGNLRCPYCHNLAPIPLEEKERSRASLRLHLTLRCQSMPREKAHFVSDLSESLFASSPNPNHFSITNASSLITA